MTRFKYDIYRPGGNETALVEGMIIDPRIKKYVNDLIMAKSLSVEQVGFVDQGEKRLEMAGGEFCGNATRCAAYKFLNGRQGEVTIQVSGVGSRMRAGVDNLGRAWAQMPVGNSLQVVGDKEVVIVAMEGITQIVVNRRVNGGEETVKSEARKIIDNAKIDSTVKAVGVMFVTKGKEVEIQPVVWVRDVNTYFYETACASGSIAVAVVDSLAMKSGVKRMKILQPSGEQILAMVEKEKSRVKNATVSGEVDKVGEGEVYV